MFSNSTFGSLDLSGWDVSSVTDVGYMFSNSTFGSLDLSGWDVSSVGSLQTLLTGISARSLDLSDWDVSSVTDMSYMFSGCSSLEALDLSGWDVSSVTDMSSMFSGCSSLSTLDITGWDTSSATSMSSMFSGCSSLSALDLSGWDVSSVTDVGYMFSNSTFGSLDLSGWDVSSVTDMYEMFTGSSIVSLDLSGWDIGSVWPSFEFIEGIVSLNLSDWNTSRMTNTAGMFSGCATLQYINLSGWDTSQVTNMGEMFFGCSSLETLDLTDWDVTSVANMDYMFCGCSSLVSLELSGWDTSQVSDMRCMFSDCSSLQYLDLSEWSTANARSADIFYGCTALHAVKVGAGFTLACAIPAYTVNGDMCWYSDGLGRTVAYDEMLTRTGIADTYRNRWSRGETNIAEAQITLESSDDLVYCGNPYRPTLNVVLDGRQLTPEDDYGITYQSNVDAGTATITVVGWGDYCGSASTTFEIMPKPVTVLADSKSKAYGEADPTFTSTVDGAIGFDKIEYELSRETGETPGEYAITPSGEVEQGNYVITYLPGTLSIDKIDLAQATVVGVEDKVYTGFVITQAPEVSVEGTVLQQGIDYDVSCDEMVDVGAGNVVIEGKGSYYKGTKTVRFRVLPKSVTVTARDALKRYGEQDPQFTAEVRGLLDDDSITYRLKREVGEDVGKYAVIPFGKHNQGNYAITYKSGSITIAMVASGFECLTVKDALSITYSNSYSSSSSGSNITVVGACGKLTYANASEDETAKGFTINQNTGVFSIPVGTMPGSYPIKVSVTDAGDRNHSPMTQEVSYVIDVTCPLSYVNASVPTTVTYTGAAVVPSPTVTLGSMSLREGIDYSVSYERGGEETADLIGAGSVSVIIEGKGNYTGTRRLYTYINAASLQGAPIVLSGSAFVYNGEVQRPSVRTVGGKELVEGTDYVVYCSNSRNVGTYSVYVSGRGNYTGSSSTAYYTIEKAPSKLTASVSSPTVSVVYDASEAVTVSSSNINYSGFWNVVSYANTSTDVTAKGFYIDYWTGFLTVPSGTKPGSYDVKVSVTDSGDGNHESATKTVSYTVKITCPMSKATVTAPAAKTYTGSAFSAAPSVKLGSTTLKAGADYTVTYTRGGKVTNDFTSAGTICATVTGKGYYTGTATANFIIRPAPLTSASVAEQAYTGGALTPSPTVKAGSLAVPASGYAVTYKDNVNVGTAAVTVTGRGNYAGTATATFRIIARSRWVKQGSSWYWYNADGSLAKGWCGVGSWWYYLDPSSGALRSGWLKDGGSWYYLNPANDSRMATGWCRVGSWWYLFASGGQMLSGWQSSGGKWYYLDPANDSRMATGWRQVGGKWYYLDSSGAMVTGRRQIGGKWYEFASSGEWVA